MTGLATSEFLQHGFTVGRPMTGSALGHMAMAVDVAEDAAQVRVLAGTGFVKRSHFAVAARTDEIADLLAVFNAARRMDRMTA